MFCKYCGEKIDDDSLYCQYCGNKVTPINIVFNSQKYKEIINSNTVLVKSKSGEYILAGNKSTGYEILNKQNKTPIIDTIFQDVFCHSRELVDTILVKKKGKWGLINSLTGIIICDYVYDDISQTEEDYNNGSGEVIVYSNGLCGKIDCEGRVIIPCIYEEIGSYGMVKYNGLWGIVKNGNQIVPCEFSFEELFDKCYKPPCF